MRRVIHWAGLTLLLASAVALAATVLVGPYRVFSVRTGSMTPTIPPRSAVVVDTREFRVGEVVSFRHEGGVITHRLISRDADGALRTKGDANDAVDPWTLRPADVIGRVVVAPQQVGYWLVYLKNPAGIGSVALGAVGLSLLWSAPVNGNRSKQRRSVKCS